MKYLADSEEYAGKQIGFVVPQTSLRKTMKIILEVYMACLHRRSFRPQMLPRRNMTFC